MKLEKREITLNEADSLKDAFYAEKILLGEYVDALCKAQRKDVRNELLEKMREVGEDLCFIRDLILGLQEDNE